MAADHYLNKVFVYIPPREDDNSPPTVSCPLYKVIYSRPRVALPSAAGSTNGGRGQMTSS